MSDEKGQSIKPKRVYIDGIWDLFHRGHVESLRKAKEFFNDPVELIVGVISDADALSYKRQPIYNEEDRYMMIRSIRYVDEVILGAPLIMTKEFVNRHRIDCIVHGFSDAKDSNKQKEFFKDVGDIFYEIPYYQHLSTTAILAKIQQLTTLNKNVIQNQNVQPVVESKQVQIHVHHEPQPQNVHPVVES